MRKALREMERYEADLVKQALGKEWKARRHAFDILQAQGHVTVMNDERPNVIRVRVDEEFFTDSREDFPTAHLMACLQLAVAAGQSDRNAARQGCWDIHPMDASQYGAMALWYDKLHDFKLGGDLLHPPVTATVKPKYRKGLRP